ncbi:MAG: hypothetical protein ABR569_11990, partial [Gaiellaceae bacterium]
MAARAERRGGLPDAGAGWVWPAVAGAGVYGSHRVATRYPTCEIAGPCEHATYKLDIPATQPGVNGGVGTQLLLGAIPVFVDIRLHYMYRTSPGGGPSNDY